MSDNVANEKKKPGRKAETPAQRLARLERDLAIARKAVADAEQRKLATVGRAVLAEAEENAAFRNQLHQLLRVRIISKAGKEAIAGLLEGTASSE